MNIHFQDENLFHELLKSTIFKIEVGSGMYGLKTEKSDTDILCIYLESPSNRLVFDNHHQFQYKQNNKDFIFTSLEQFIKNILIGDSTINFEVLTSKEFREIHNFKLLSDIIIGLCKEKISKTYLGMAKRDCKNMKNDSKRICHFIRGILFAECLMDNRDLHDFIKEKQEFFMDIKTGKTIPSEKCIGEITQKMNLLREQCVVSNYDYKQIYNINKIIKSIYMNNALYDINYKNIIEKAFYNNDFGYN